VFFTNIGFNLTFTLTPLGHRVQGMPMISVAMLTGRKSKSKVLKLVNSQDFRAVADACQELSTLFDYQEVTAGADSECLICLERQPDEVLACMVVTTQHAFCQVCLDSWQVRNGSCPLCRESIRPEESFTILEFDPKEKQAMTAQKLQDLFYLIDLK
jgi:hypothetical protein